MCDRLSRCVWVGVAGWGFHGAEPSGGARADREEFADGGGYGTGAALAAISLTTLIKQVNASYQQMWPAQYVPVRDAIVESYNPSILADVTAHGLEIPSPILMSENIH